MRHLLILLLVVPVGCASRTAAAEEAEKQYNFVVENAGGWRERCDAAKKARDAYREAKDETKYTIWNVRVTSDCDTADRVAGVT